MLSAALDLFVFLDFSLTHGRHAPQMLAGGNLTALIVLSIAAAVVVQGRELSEVEAAILSFDDRGDKETIAAIQRFLEAKRFYRDPDLNRKPVALAVVGVIIGLTASWLVFNGWQASTVGSNNASMSFELTLDGGVVLL